MAAQNWWEEVEEVDSPVAATEETPWWETVEEVGATAPAPTIPEPVEPTAIAEPVEADTDKPWYEQVEIVEPIAPRPALPTIATEPQEGFLRPVADPFLNIAAGINDVVKGFSDAFGADNAVSQNLAKNSEWYRSLLSAGAKEDQEEIGRIMQEAEGQGVLAEIGAGLKALSVAPVDLVAQGIGSLIPFIATAGVGKAVGLSKAGIAVLQGVQGGAVGGGIVKGEIYSAVKEQLINSGVDEAKAEKAAQEAQAYNGKNLDQILLGVGLGVAASTSGADSAIRSLIARKVGKEAAEQVSEQAIQEVLRTGFVRGAVKDGTVEFATEALQGGQERLAANIAVGREGFDVEPMRGVVGQATLEGTLGSVLGGAAGGINAKVEQMDARQKVALQDAQKAAEEAKQSNAPASAAAVEEQINQTIEETPDEKVVRLQREAQEAAGEIELEEEPPVSGLPPVEPTPPVTPTPEAAVAPVEPVVPAEGAVEPAVTEVAPETVSAPVVVRQGEAGVDTNLTAEDKAYRGMTEEEFNNTVLGAGGVESRGDFRFGEEGTNFAEKFEDAESYINFGRDDPRKTGKPTYIVEVDKQPLQRNRRGDYEAFAPVAPTKAWKITAQEGELVATEMQLPAAPEAAPAAVEPTPVTPPVTPEAPATAETRFSQFVQPKERPDLVELPEFKSFEMEVRGVPVRFDIDTTKSDENTLYLESFRVPRDERRQGVGREAMTNVLRWADENNVTLKGEALTAPADRQYRTPQEMREQGYMTPRELFKFYQTLGWERDPEGPKKTMGIPMVYRPKPAAEVAPTITPQLEPLRRVARAEQTEEDVAGLVDSGFVEVYNGQPVITQAGLEALPEAERPRLTPEARKIQIDTRTSEPAAEAISKNLRIGVDQVPVDVRMPAGWTLVGDVYVPPQPQAVATTPEVREARREPAITPQQDRDYLDAVERGDLDAASRVVEDAAKAAGVPTIGVNINDGEQSFTEQILNGDKTIETRDSENNALAGLVGQRIAIVRTGRGRAKVVGYATVGEPIRYTSKSQFDADYNKHLVSGGKYGFKGFKIGYPMLDVERIDAYDAPPATGVIKTRPIHAPIERDDQGNIIPLSKRFQPEQADIRYRRRVQMGRAGMEPSAVEARLQELGFPTGGIIRVVNQPDADFEGRTIILDGKVTGIELNASALKDNAAIDRVLNHEFAESANADGALNKLVERLTPKEKKEINDTITRLRYEERARTSEEAARAIETLAEAWRGRGFFARAVARVEAWASKLGFKLTRRAAEYIAARNLAEVNDNVRKWHIGEAMANIKGARRIIVDGVQAVLIPPSEMRVAYSIAAYHGTPHKIKGGFQLAKIGTGEGEQAYGWGLYFAENIEVAKGYQRNLSKGQYALSYEGVPVNELPTDQKNAILKIAAGVPKDTVIADLESSLRRQEASKPEDWAVPANRERVIAELKSSIEEAKKIKPNEIKPRTAGNLYRVELDVTNDQLLDWDKPLSEQSEKVKEAFLLDAKKRIPIIEKTYRERGLSEAEIKKIVEATLNDAIWKEITGGEWYFSFGKESAKETSELLLSWGILGIRYLDQGSRDSGKGTYNYVIFDESKIKITEINGQPVDIRESRREPEAIPTFTEGTPEAATLKEMATSMAKADAASEAKGGKPETYKISEIASVWMDSGLGERELQDAIVEYTNLTPANAKRVARAIAKQYDTQQQLAEAVLETEAGAALEGVPEGMEIPKDVDPKNKRTVLQRVIDSTTGVRVKPVILQVPEKSALKEQIRMKARETREAKKAQQETANAVVEAIKALELRGPMRPKQAQALAKRAAKVIWTSEKSMENFIAYAERVMANTNYDADLREAKAAQKRAKELSKRDSIAAPQRETLEAIGNIGINLLNDPREFADVVNHYLRSFKPVVSEAYVVVPDSEMKSYLSAAEDVVNDAKAEFEAEDNERLADKYGITIDELKKYMDAEEIMDALTRYAKREVIEGILNEKSAGVKEALKGVDTTTLRADQRKLIDAMKVIDVKSLDAAEKQAYVRIGNNIIFNNNQTNGAEFFVATAKGQQAARDLAKNTEAMTKNKAWSNIVPALGSRRAKKILKAWAEDLQSVADTFRNAFGKEAMTVFYEAMGMVDLDLGFTNAARTLEEIQSKMEKFYKKLDKKYKGAATNQDGILSEGIVGYLIQNVPEKGEADSLAQRRGLLQQDIAERRKSGDEDRMQMADRIQELMQKLDGETVDQILANLKREYPANYESLTWLKDELFPQYKDFLKQFDENFNDQANNYNTPNYLPIVYSNISPSIDLLQGKKKYYDNLSSAPKQSSYTIKRSDYTQLPLGDDGRKPKEIGLNLRRNAYNSLSDQITRAYTNPARQRIYSFLKTPESEEALGGAANRDFFAERIERLMESRERRGSFNKNAFEKAVDVLANLGRDIGTRIALAGSYQLIRQPADQVTVAIGVTGRADLMAKHLDPRQIKAARPVIDLFSIGRRGDASSGYKYINQMEGAQSRLERYYTEGNWVKAKEAAKNFADKFMAPLKVSDFTVAAATWMTFYRAYLAKNGIKFTTWEDAANLIKSDDVGHKRAAAYAENMTDIYQGSSDPTKMAVFAQKGKTGPENLLKAILVPFNSFGVQFRSRISSELTEIFTKSGDWRGKAVAVKDLGATIGGTIMFGLAKRFVLPAITYGGVKILYSIFGVDVEEPDEEKQKEEFELKWRQLQGDIVSTMIVGGGGQMLESYTIDGMNYLKYMIDSANGSEDVLDDDGEVMSFNKYAKERAPFYRYRSFDNAFSLGILDIGMDQAKKSILNTKMVLTPEEMDKYTPEEQRFLLVALISDWLYLGGFNDADFARMWDKGRRDMINARKEEEKELKRIRSGR